MKNIAKSAVIALLIASVGCNAFADGRYGYHGGGYHGSYHGRGHDSDWVAPLLFLGLAGAVIGAAASQSTPAPVYVAPPVTYVQPAPAPVYVAPQPVAQPAPPANMWYFCRPVGQYYPYTQTCPEPWQLVAPAPQ